MTPPLAGLLWTQRPDLSWYGLQPWWQQWIEAGARAEHGNNLHLRVGPDHITYRLPIDVRGRHHPVAVHIEFHRWPPYDCYGLPPEEYPRVFAVSGVTSPHRMPTDQALCLYYPMSPPCQRWQPVNGLLALIDLARDHVFFEDYWRATGAQHGGTWLGAEAPHGFN